MLSQNVISVITSLFSGGRGPEAMQLLQAAGGQDSYSGYAGQTASMGFTTFGGNMGHNQMALNPGAFSSPWAGMFAAPYISDALAPMNTINSGLVLAQNSAQVAFAGYQDAMSSVLSETLEKSARRQGYTGDMDWGVAANFLTASTFNSPLSADFLGFISATGLDKDEGIREGLLGAGVSQLSLNKYGLSSSLLHGRETQILEQNLRAAAENEDIGMGDALAAATSINDRRLRLNTSDKYTGFGDSAEFSKVTEDLKRAKELTGQSNVQTLSLLAEVYDNVIEGIIPQLGEFTDRMMILERQGVSVHEYASTVKNLRQKFRLMGIEDTNFVPDLVNEVHSSRRSQSQQHWAAGETDYNYKVAEARRFEQTATEAKSKEMSLANLLMVMTNSRTAEDFDALIANPDSIEDPNARMIAEAFASGDPDAVISTALKFARGGLGDERSQWMMGRNAQNAGAIFGSDAWGRYTRMVQPSISPQMTDLFNMPDQEEATRQFYEYKALAYKSKGSELAEGWTIEGDYYVNSRTGKTVALNELGYLRESFIDYEPHSQNKRTKAERLDDILADPRRWIKDEYGDASKWQDIMHGRGVDTVEQVYGIFMSAAMADTTDDNAPLLAQAEEFLESAKNADGSWKFSTEQIKAGKKDYYTRAGNKFTKEQLESFMAEGSEEDALLSMIRETDRISKMDSPTRANNVSKSNLQMLASSTRLGQGRDTTGLGEGKDGQASEVIRLLRQLVINTDEDSKIQTSKVEKLDTDEVRIP